jgi:hypothetical protein
MLDRESQGKVRYHQMILPLVRFWCGNQILT